MTHLTLMNVDTLEEFFKRCKERNLTTEKERMEVLAELVKENKAEYLGSTKYGKATVARKLGGKLIGKPVKPSVRRDDESINS